MKKYRHLILLLTLLVGVFTLSSCEMTCRCYHYNGTIDEYTAEELKELDYTCGQMKDIDLGLRYSLCEKVLF